MTLLAQIVADCSVSVGAAAIADASVDLTNSEIAIASASVDTDVAAAIFPRGERPFQILAPVQIRLDGVLIPANRILPGTTWRETIEGAQSFSFQVAAVGADPDEFSEPLGTIEASSGPPGSGQSIDIDVVYLTSSGPKSIRVISGGVITASQRDFESGIRTVAGNGARTRYDRQTVDLEIPAGAGLSASEQVTRVLAEIGLPPASQRPPRLGRRRYKSLSAHDAPAIDLAGRILQPESRVLFFDRDGRPAIRSLTNPEVPVGVTLDAFDVLTGRGGINEATSAEGPTEVCVRGVEQVLGGLDGNSIYTSRNGQAVTDASGRTLFVVYFTRFEARKRKPVEVEVSSLVVPYGDLIQDGAGAQSGSAVIPVTLTNVIESRVEVVESIDFCTVTIEDRSTFGWYLEERGVALTNISTQSLDFYPSVYIDSETNRGVRYHYGRFQKVQRVIVSKGYDANGFLVGEDRRTFSFYNPRRATREWNGTTELYEYRSGVKVLLSGDGVENLYESFIETERVSTVYTNDAEGFTRAATTYLSRYFSPPAPAGSARYSYGSGIFSEDEAESFAVFETRQQIFEPLAGDADHRETIIATKNDGSPRVITTRAGQGYLPAAEKKQESIPDPSLYPAGVIACPGNQRAIEGCYGSDALEEIRDAWTEVVGADRIEDANEALDLAKATFEIRNSGRLSFSVPLNAYLRPGLEVTLSLAPHAPDRVLLVEEVVGTEGPDGSVSRVTGRFSLA